MKSESRKSLIAFSVVILGFLAIINGIALTLNDMPNESSFGPQVKGLINSNNTLLELWAVDTTNSATNAVNSAATASAAAIVATNAATQALATVASQVITITPVCATNANGGTNVITFTAKDYAGAAITYPTAFRFWISDDGFGTPAAVAGDVVISAGVELQEVLNKADYYIMSTGNVGTVVATITDTPGGTNYIHVMAPCGKITKITSAFRVP